MENLLHTRLILELYQKMKSNKKKIVFNGGNGRFGKVFKKMNNDYQIFYPTKITLDITKIETIRSYLKKIKPKIFYSLCGVI